MAKNRKINQFIYLTKRYFMTYLGISISVVLFIQFFQPFTIDRFDFENELLFIAGFGLIIIICLLFSQIVFQDQLVQSENDFHSDPINLTVFYFSLVVTASLAFSFYIRYVGQRPITFSTVVRVVIICLSLPVTVSLKDKISNDQVRIRKLMQESRSIQEKLKKYSKSYANEYVEIISENSMDNFRIQVSEIVYLKSADNYVEIGYYEEDVVKRKMVRNTLRSIERQLSQYSNFIRTHRTSIVNIRYIEKLNKTYSNYWLSIDKTKETIPVSRQYLLAVKDLFKRPGGEYHSQ